MVLGVKVQFAAKYVSVIILLMLPIIINTYII